jgi:DNA-binding LytR/AlgR family response regulator
MTPEMRIAGSELTKSIANANHRPAVKHISWHALVFHPAAVNNSVFVFTAKPIMTAKFSFLIHNAIYC